ncbi:MAG TPA: histidine phosphatase family protein [Steroidobacteraceae bacterium]|nr:histidine phosphatase family protein [Steroidobacteraceae bacterium]
MTHSTLYLVRHGQSQTNAGGITLENPLVPLTELGAQQAQAVAALLPAAAHKVWSSPFKRALDTAAPYCALVEQVPAIHDDLREFEMIDTTQLRGSAVAEREAAMARYWLASDPDHRAGPAAETFREFHDRVARVRGEFLPDVAPGSVIFGHGIWMALLFWQILGFETVDGAAMARFRRFQLGFPTPNTAVYRLTHVAPGKWDVKADEGAMRAIAALSEASRKTPWSASART